MTHYGAITLKCLLIAVFLTSLMLEDAAGLPSPTVALTFFSSTTESVPISSRIRFYFPLFHFVFFSHRTPIPIPTPLHTQFAFGTSRRRKQHPLNHITCNCCCLQVQSHHHIHIFIQFCQCLSRRLQSYSI